MQELFKNFFRNFVLGFYVNEVLASFDWITGEFAPVVGAFNSKFQMKIRASRAL